MKIKLYVCAAFVLSLFLNPNANGQISNVGLVAHWMFNGNAADSSGNGNHGTVNNITYTTGMSGQPNTAAVFDGSTSYITVPYSLGLNLTNYSICAKVWINSFYTGTCQVNTILQRGASYANGNYALWFADTITDCSSATVDTGAYTLVTETGPNNLSMAGNTWWYKPTLRTGRWYSIVATWNGSIVRIYMNGRLIHTAAPSPVSVIGSSTDGLTIGAAYNYGSAPNSTWPYWFSGKMDDLRIYARVLADTEIRTLAVLPVFDTPPASLCIGKPFNIAYKVTDTFNTTNNFTVQLSNASGYFSTPTVLGTVSGNRAGSISCIVPGIVTAGTGYKIRLVASSPAAISDTVNVVVNSPVGPPSVLESVTPGNYISAGTSVTFLATPANAVSTPTFKWYKNSVLIPSQISSTYIAVAGTDFNDGDSINVSVNSSAVCTLVDTALSNAIKMHISSSIAQAAGEGVLQIFPNPSKGIFQLNAKMGSSGNVLIDVSDVVGRTIYTEMVSAPGNRISKTIDLGGIEEGTYLLHFRTETESKTQVITIHR